MAAILLLFCIAVSAYTLLYLWQRRARAQLAGATTWPALPILGNIHQILGDGKHHYNHMMKILKIMDENGNKPIALWMGPFIPIVGIAHPDDVKIVANAFADKPYFYHFSRVWIGNGLLSGPQEIYKHHIKKLSGTFTRKIVNGYQDIINYQADKLVQKMKAEVGGKPFDVFEKYLSFTTLESICQTALGVGGLTDTIATAEYQRAFARTLEILINRAINPFLHINALFKLTPVYKELTKNLTVLHNVSETIVDKRQKEWNEKKHRVDFNKNGVLSDDHKPRFKPFLDILLDVGDTDPTMTRQMIKEEVDTIILAAQETTAIALQMAMIMLGSYRKVQDKLYDEMKEIFGDSKRPVETEDLLRMPYCEAVIKETLRLYPSIPAVMRLADHDLQLSTCTIPKGSMCCILIGVTGRSKLVWGEDAKEFRPERWFEANCWPDHSSKFIPFSYGKRSCIGIRYAFALMKTVLSHCVREFVITSEADKLDFKINISLKADSGQLIQLQSRK